jgi:NAD(P)H dehydrogenase (quinone)
MRLLLISAHPNSFSLNHRLAQRLQDRFLEGGVEVEWSDLYREKFDPVLSREELLRKGSFDPLVLRHAETIRNSAGLVIVHPDWWGLPPAILKGWVDRVLLPGVGYMYEEGSPIPLLSHVKGAVVVTRDNPGRGLSENFWLQEVFPLCGISPACCHILDGLKIRQPYEVERIVADVIEELYTYFVTF